MMTITNLDGIYHLLDEQTNKSIGILDSMIARHLQSLEQYQQLMFTAILSTACLHGKGKASGSNKSIVDVSVNILGPEALCDKVGNQINGLRVYLQHPDYLPSDIAYINPHFLYSDEVRTDLRDLIGPRQTNPVQSRVTEGVGVVLSTLGDVSYFPLTSYPQMSLVRGDGSRLRSELKP